MTTTKPSGGPAFPTPAVFHPGGGRGNPEREGMTLRQYAAIKLRVPNSGIDWLDKMIRERQREDLAATALQALITRERNDDEVWNSDPLNDPDGLSMAFGERSHMYADAMLLALNRAQAEAPEQLVPLAHLKRLVDTMDAYLAGRQDNTKYPPLESARAYLASLPVQPE